ncbi:MAG: hypothetical protein JSR93_03930 [Verrucomicrobia bacterium]|nr:hypothetical protein [Verrucomicrobiota bacterium]
MALHPSESKNVYDHLYTLYASDDHNALRASLDALPVDFRNKVCYNIYDLAGKPAEPNYGQVHVFDSLPRLQEAVQRVAFEVFDTISQNERNGIAGKVWARSGSPQTNDPQWGEHHAKDNVRVLLNSLSESLGDLTPRHETILEDWHRSQGGRQESAVTVFRSFIKGESLGGWCANTASLMQMTLYATISSLPPMLNEKPFPERLRFLTMCYSFLGALPREIGQLSHLQRLELHSSGVTSVPPEIGGMDALRYLCLESNRGLQGLPSEILNLSPECTIDLTNTGLSQNVLDHLHQAVTAEGYHGPRFSYDMWHAEQHHDGQIRSFAQLVQELSSVACEEPREYPHLAGEGNVATWISRLSDTADYKRQGQFQVEFAKKIIGYLKQAEEDPEFREVFLNIIADASETCGDRVSLSILHVGIAKRLKMLEGQGLKPLAEFLTKTVWPIQLLEEIARDKTEVLPFFDEIEVYLGYPIKLREKLRLEIDVEDMLYFRCSALTDQDLESAVQSVQSKQQNDEEKCAFLVQRDDWKKALEAAYPEQYAASMDKAYEELEAEVDPVVVEGNRLNALQALTAWALIQ